MKPELSEREDVRDIGVGGSGVIAVQHRTLDPWRRWGSLPDRSGEAVDEAEGIAEVGAGNVRLLSEELAALGEEARFRFGDVRDGDFEDWTKRGTLLDEEVDLLAGETDEVRGHVLDLEAELLDVEEGGRLRVVGLQEDVGAGGIGHEVSLANGFSKTADHPYSSDEKGASGESHGRGGVLAEADEAEVIEGHGGKDGGGQGEAGEDARTEFLGEQQAGHGGGDADQAAEPGPGVRGGDTSGVGKRLAEEELREEETSETGGIDDHAGPDRLAQLPVELGVSPGLEGVCSFGGDGDQIGEPEHG